MTSISLFLFSLDRAKIEGHNFCQKSALRMLHRGALLPDPGSESAGAENLP